MAVFGAPIAHEDDAERAVRAALRILETIEELRGEGLDVAVRAAVTTGEAVVALGARPERGEGIVAGDVVNTAARLQGAAPVGAVIVDERDDALDRARDRVRAARAGRGEGEAGADPGLASGRRPQPRSAWTPRLRRTDALRRARLRARAARARRSRARCASRPRSSSRSSAEPGVGKSRLVWEFREEIDRRPDLVRWRQGRCLPYGEGITFWALGEIVKAEAGVLETDSPRGGSREARPASRTSSPTRPSVRGSSIDLRRSSVRRTRCRQSGARRRSPPGGGTSRHLPLTGRPSS